MNTLEKITRYPIIKSLKTVNEKICLSTSKGHSIIRKQDINYIKADSNYSTIYYSDKKIMCSHTLKELFSRLQIKSFIRTHRSYVINLEKISLINREFTEIIMEDGSHIPISRAQKKAIRENMKVLFD